MALQQYDGLVVVTTALIGISPSVLGSPSSAPAFSSVFSRLGKGFFCHQSHQYSKWEAKLKLDLHPIIWKMTLKLLSWRTGANFNNHVLRMITEGQSQQLDTTFGDSGTYVELNWLSCCRIRKL